jgi:IclR family acetate operon transcriptional repressor
MAVTVQRQSDGAEERIGAGGPEKQAEPTSAVDRALELWKIVVNAERPLTLAEVAGQAQLSKPTAHRILKTLITRGFLRQDQSRSYRLGPETFALAGRALEQMEYAGEARVGIDYLKGLTPEKIHFAALVGDVPVHVAEDLGSRPYRLTSNLGLPVMLHCTAIGKAILGFLPPERAARRLSGEVLTPRTARTITTVPQLMAQLEQIRAQGYAIDDEENEDNIRCVGAPVFDAMGQLVGGLGVSALTLHLSLSEAHALAPAVVAAAGKISTALGASPEFVARIGAGATPAAQ